MSLNSVLENIHLKGQFGDHEDKNENDLIKVSEKKNLLIVQIVQYKNSSFLTDKIKIDNLDLNYFKNSNKKELNIDFSNSLCEDAKNVYSNFNEKLILK